MSQKAKDAFEEFRKWVVLLSVLMSAGGVSFVLYSFRAEVKTIVREELKAYVSTAEFTAEKAAAKELQFSEARNLSDRLGRIETDVKELKNYFIPSKRHAAVTTNQVSTNIFYTVYSSE